jgi:hypothetical protein
LELWNMPSSHHHYPHRLSHPNSVVQRPGRRISSTASSLADQFWPWDQRYFTKKNSRLCVQPFPTWFSVH